MRGVPRWFAVLCVVAFAVVVCAFSLRRALAPASMQLQLSQVTLPADGFSTTELKIHSTRAIRHLSVESGNERRVTVESVIVKGDDATATLRAGVMPGETSLRVSADGISAGKIEVSTAPDFSDSFGDGTPDFLRLHDAADRRGIPRWFTLLAESQYYREPQASGRDRRLRRSAALQLPRSAAPARLRLGQQHGTAGDVCARVKFASITIRYTPLGAAMFRVRDGSFVSDDLSDGSVRRVCRCQDPLARQHLQCGTRPRPRSSRRPAVLSPVGRSHLRYHAMIFVGRKPD